MSMQDQCLKLGMNPAKGQASLPGETGEVEVHTCEVHEWDLSLEDTYKLVERVEEERVVPPSHACHPARRGLCREKHSSNP